MKKSKKILIIVIFVVVLIAAAIVGIVLNRVNTTSDLKEFTIVVQSERDGIDKTIDCKSDLGTLGEYVRTMDECSWEDSSYGTYITGWYGAEQDLDNQYWWCVSVNNEQSANGVDLIPLEDGCEYEFVLVQGW